MSSGTIHWARWVWLLAWSWALVSCIRPGSAGTTANGEEQPSGRCVAPTRSLPPLHVRSDVTWPGSACRRRAADLLAGMSLRDKLGQMLQPDRGKLERDSDVTELGLGSVLSGGDTDPPRNGALDWTRMVSQLRGRSLRSAHGIPLLYGVDAVHGHSNVRGAVVFPHNIALGATRDAALVERIGRATAEALAATGIDWNFAPVLAAARDERWGRTYEAYGETFELAQELGTAMIRGLQGDALGQGPASVLACAKHFIGDGGTTGGRDQGDTRAQWAQVQALHLPAYAAAVQAGVGSIMASFSSLNGDKMHCHGRLLTDVLKGELGFHGFVVSDWEAIEKLPGDYPDQLAAAITAGIDMVMAPKSYRRFLSTMEDLVPERVPTSRIDDAAARILSVKCELGLFEPKRMVPSRDGLLGVDPAFSGRIAPPEHRALAREAVAKSLVLLKNERAALPLKPDAQDILVAGRNAADLGHQCGGWTINWQGGSGPITDGTTIVQAIKRAAPAASVTYERDGRGTTDAAVAIAVLGEGPYAEGHGDRADLALTAEDLEVLRNLRRRAAKVVLVLVSGRPLILGEALDLADAVVAAWLPGTEGDGVADVLFGCHPPTGKLSHSWPRSMAQVPINVGDADYDPLFPYGFGLSYETADGTRPQSCL